MTLKAVEGVNSKRGTLGTEMRREKSLRISVHHATAVVWGPVYRARLRLRRVRQREHDEIALGLDRIGSDGGCIVGVGSVAVGREPS